MSDIVFVEQTAASVDPPVGATEYALFKDSADGVWKDKSSTGVVTPVATGGGGNDPDAIHVDVAGEIAALPLVTAAGADLLVIEDASDSNNKKRILASDLMLPGVWTHNAVVSIGASPYLAAIFETVKVNVDSGLITITLPTAVGNAGRQIKVVSLSDAGSPNVCTVQTTGGQTINGTATRTLTTAREVLLVESDGANWLAV